MGKKLLGRKWSSILFGNIIATKGWWLPIFPSLQPGSYKATRSFVLLTFLWLLRTFSAQNNLLMISLFVFSSLNGWEVKPLVGLFHLFAQKLWQQKIFFVFFRLSSKIDCWLFASIKFLKISEPKESSSLMDVLKTAWVQLSHFWETKDVFSSFKWS